MPHASYRESALSAAFNKPLNALGLTKCTPLRWIDGSNPSSRRVFEFQLTKGDGILASWGFSLDIVPHISGGRLLCHRSDKTAGLDVFICPEELNQAYHLVGPKRFAKMVLPEAVPAAQRDWARGETLEGMLNIVKEIRDRKRANYWPYESWAQLPLAFAFLSAKLGHPLKSAERDLEPYTELLTVAEYARLHRLLHEAAEPEKPTKSK